MSEIVLRRIYQLVLKWCVIVGRLHLLALLCNEAQSLDFLGGTFWRDRLAVRTGFLSVRVRAKV